MHTESKPITVRSGGEVRQAEALPLFSGIWNFSTEHACRAGGMNRKTIIAWGCMVIMTLTGWAAASAEPEPDGAVVDTSRRDAPQSTVSKDIVAFSVQFAWNDEIGHSENGMFVPDAEQPYPQGIWRLTLKKSQTALCWRYSARTPGCGWRALCPLPRSRPCRNSLSCVVSHASTGTPKGTLPWANCWICTFATHRASASRPMPRAAAPLCRRSTGIRCGFWIFSETSLRTIPCGQQEIKVKVDENTPEAATKGFGPNVEVVVRD